MRRRRICHHASIAICRGIRIFHTLGNVPRASHIMAIRVSERNWIVVGVRVEIPSLRVGEMGEAGRVGTHKPPHRAAVVSSPEIVVS